MTFLEARQDAKKSRESAWDFISEYGDCCGVIEVCEYCEFYHHENPIVEKWVNERNGVEEYLHKHGVYYGSVQVW